jgi:hypothetical protein
MSVVQHLSALALRGLAGGTAQSLALGDGEHAADALFHFLTDRFRDHSQRLPAALRRAGERAWRALEIALAGESLWSRLDRADDRAFRRQLRLFLDAAPLAGLCGHDPEFRRQCLREFQAVRKAGLLAAAADPHDLVRQAAGFARFAGPHDLVGAEWRAVERLAGELHRAGYRTLAYFLNLRPAPGEPLLAVAVRFFFRREVEGDPELARGLAFGQLGELAEKQRAGFAALEDVLNHQGARLAEALDVLADVRGGVLDLRAEQQRQGRQLQELHQAVLQALARHRPEQGALPPPDGNSIPDEGERPVRLPTRAALRRLSQARRFPRGDPPRLPVPVTATAELPELPADPPVDPWRALAARELLVEAIAGVVPYQGFPIAALPFLIVGGVLALGTLVTGLVALGTGLDVVGQVSFGLGLGAAGPLSLGAGFIRWRRRGYRHACRQVRDRSAAVLGEHPPAAGVLGAAAEAGDVVEAAWKLVRYLEARSGKRVPVRLFAPAAPGSWVTRMFLGNPCFELVVDGQFFGTSSVARGFDVRVETTAGRHQLLYHTPFGLGRGSHRPLLGSPRVLDIHFDTEAVREIELRFNRTNRTFEITRMS